jgi:hypothetical protein
MRFLITNCDYPAFLSCLYAQNPGLTEAPYAEQLRVRNESLFGTADFYSEHLRRLGHDAIDIHINNKALQLAWAREQGITVPGDVAWTFRLRRGIVPWLSRQRSSRWMYAILRAQIEQYQPDVVLNHQVALAPDFFRSIRPQHGLLIGQHAATALPAGADFGGYDLMLSSFPPTLEFFRPRGIAVRLLRLGFDPRALTAARPADAPEYQVTMVGSLEGVHRERLLWLEELCRALPQLRVFGPAPTHLPASSPIHAHYEGQAWGRAMFGVLSRSRIAINHHGSVPPYANNMRLYEATGMGALLLTDWKPDLEQIFVPGREAVAYHSTRMCLDQIHYYLAHDDQRRTIARAGQARTLREHSYAARMRELLSIIEEVMPAGAGRGGREESGADVISLRGHGHVEKPPKAKAA